MAQPPVYTRQYNFTDFQTVNPTTPLPANQVDIEYNAIKTTLDATLFNLGLIQRDDGRLGNQSVAKESLSEEVLALIGGVGNPRGNWATATAYAVLDLVNNSGNSYLCAVAHTSGGSFATDLAAGKWVIFSSGAGSVRADGTTVVTADITLSGHKLIGVANGTTRTDAATVGQLQDGNAIWAGSAGGTANAITLTVSPAITTLTEGLTVIFAASATNTDAATLAVDGTAATAVKYGGDVLIGGEIVSPRLYRATYRSLAWEIQPYKPGLFGDQTSTSINGGAAAGPIWTLNRKSPTPAANDILGQFLVKGTSVGVGIASITRVGTLATLTTSVSHGLTTGDQVTLIGQTPAGYGGTYAVTVTGANIFTYTMAADPGGSASLVGTYTVLGRNYGKITTKIVDATSATEDSTVALGTLVGGVETDGLVVGQGVQIGAPSGGDKGVGTLNLPGPIYLNGSQLLPGSVPVRQTVMSGPVDTNGFSAFGGSTGSATVTASGTLLVTAANGFDVTGQVNRIGLISNPAWSSLSTNGTMYLYLDIAADGTCTPGAGTLAPTYRNGGADVTTNGQFTFNIGEMVGKVGNGSAAVQTYRVYVGQVTVASNVVSAINWYALNGRYRSATIAALTAAATTTSFTHNLGISMDVKLAVYMRCIVNDANWLVGHVTVPSINTGTNIVTTAVPYLFDTVSGGFISGATSTGWNVANRTTGAITSPTAASWQWWVTMIRDWGGS